MQSIYVNGTRTSIGSGSITISNGNVIVSGETELPATREQLQSRYPGVEFVGSAGSAQIETSVHIEAGAIITLSPDLKITGDSQIGSEAVVSGGAINFSCVGGLVSGGKINHSKICPGGSIKGGSVNFSKICPGGSVEGGRINHSKVESGGKVTNGSANHTIICGTVSGGSLNHSTVPSGQTVSRSSHKHATINGSAQRHGHAGGSSQTFVPSHLHHVTVNGHISSGEFPFVRALQPNHTTQQRAGTVTQPDASPNRLRLPPPRKAPEAGEKFDEDPPESLVDEYITYQLIDEAIMTPNGDTYDRQTIEREIIRSGKCPVTNEPLSMHDLRPNRALQKQIDEWKAAHRVG